MRYFEFDLGKMPEITLIGKEVIEPHELHVTRFSPEYIMYIVTDGELNLEENGQELCLVAGDVYIFKKGEFHCPNGQSNGRYFFVHFETESFRELEIKEEEYLGFVKEKREKNLTRSIRKRDCHTSLITCVKQKYNIKDEGFFDYITKSLEKGIQKSKHFDTDSYIDVSSSISKILLRLEKYGLAEIEGNSSDKRRYAMVKKIVRYLEENLTQNIWSADVETHCDLNFDYANRNFKKIMGTSIMKYHNILKLEKAKTTLAVTDKPIAEIARELGMNDVYYFGRMFKNKEGISPGRYRQMIKGEVEDDL